MYQYPSFGQEIQQTAARSTETLGLPQKAVDLIHLVNPGFRPAFFCNSAFDFMPERFKIFWVGKEMVYCFRGRLYTQLVFLRSNEVTH